MTTHAIDPETAAAKADIFAVLDTSPNEVPALLAALKEGRIDGAVYVGPCCCLVGTLADAAGKSVWDVPWRHEVDGLSNGLARSPSSPAEDWFFDINEGDTPATNECSEITVEWVEEWMAKRAEASK